MYRGVDSGVNHGREAHLAQLHTALAMTPLTGR
jgi:hypothetical protein